MNRIVTAILTTMAIATWAIPASALEGRHGDELYAGMGNKLSERHQEAFEEGLGNKLSERTNQEFYDGLGNKLSERHEESFYDGMGNKGQYSDPTVVGQTFRG